MIQLVVFIHRSLMVKEKASGRKMTDFMTDAVCFWGLCTIFGTVRQVFRRFSDGRSEKGLVAFLLEESDS